MTCFPHKAERDHEDPSDIGRPDVSTAEQDEHDLLSFRAMCRAVGQSDRLLRLQRGMLKHSIRLAEPDGEEAEDA